MPLPSPKQQQKPKPKKLSDTERLYYRDQLRSARYAALADSEGFLSVCFALESLGLRLKGRKADLGNYRRLLKQIAEDSVVLSELTNRFPSTFTHFDALFELVRTARNDAMHSGVYARHATAAAIELCIGLEEAVMKKEKHLQRHLVKHYMVKSPIAVESWEPVAHARQLMLTYSFSYLPVWVGEWKLVSDASMARYIQSSSNGGDWADSLATSIENAQDHGLKLVRAQVVALDDEVHTLLGEHSDSQDTEPRLWLVVDSTSKLRGVLSPFELM